ncbi:MAG: putative damage-inducible protein DinB [Arcticibacterium sp.]|jgi:uncharacterized damage-inducible protein DinB
MKKLLTPLNILLALFITSFSSAMAIESPIEGSKSAHIEDFKRAKAFSLEYMEAMPENGYNFKPTEDIRSFAQQFLHLAGANFGLTSAIIGDENPLGEKNPEKEEASQNKEAAMKIVSDSYDHVINAIKSLSEEQWNEQIKLFGNFEMTRARAFDKIFEHGTHHRGQATIYLRLKGATPPSEKLF